MKIVFKYGRPLLLKSCQRRLATASKDKRDAGFVEQPPSFVPTITYMPGEAMKNINIFAHQPEPQAMHDTDYPPWIYDCLDSHTKQPSLRERVKKMRKEYFRKRNLAAS